MRQINRHSSKSSIKTFPAHACQGLTTIQLGGEHVHSMIKQSLSQLPTKSLKSFLQANRHVVAYLQASQPFAAHESCENNEELHT